MRVEAFDFDLPRDRIAARPARPRDSARLLVVAEGCADHRVRALPGLLRAGDLLVVNDTRVIPARLVGRRGQGRVEATLVRDLGEGRWRALARPARRLKAGDRLMFAPGFEAEVEARGDRGEVTLRFDRAQGEVMAALERHGTMPLPPYIPRRSGPDARDRRDYQTVFAARPGAVAAPTAGLHFTPALLAALEAAGIARVEVTLHVGPGSFRPVTVADSADHAIDPEPARLSAAVAARINEARARGGRVVAVGSTALRLLETAAGDDGRLRPFEGETDLFITPGYRFKAVDLLLTNFHLPRSTLFMLVAAFAGLVRIKAAYAHAIEAGYRFYSYGDACLLHPAPS